MTTTAPALPEVQMAEPRGLVSWLTTVDHKRIGILYLGSMLTFFLVGSTLGFLWYNCHPARAFMGDTGSLPLGGLIGYVAVVTRQELMLLIAGGVFVIEAISVIAQVGYFKWSKGRRLFRCAPVHHHFHLGGWSEPQTVVRFWLLAVMFAAFALATIKIR